MEVMSYAKGISWINDCRIPFVDDGDKGAFNKNSEGINRQKTSTVMETYMNNSFIIGNHNIDDTRQQGRFPANILVSDDMLNDGVVGGSSYCPPTKYEYEMSEDKFNSGGRRTKTGIGDKGSNSRYYSLDKWFEQLLEL